MAKRRAKKSKKAASVGAGYVSAKYPMPRIRDYVVAELKYETPLAYAATGFAGPAAAEPQAGSLNRILERFKIAAVRSHLGVRKSDIRQRVSVASALPAAPSPARPIASGRIGFVWCSGSLVVGMSGDILKACPEHRRMDPAGLEDGEDSPGTGRFRAVSAGGSSSRSSRCLCNSASVRYRLCSIRRSYRPSRSRTL